MCSCPTKVLLGGRRGVGTKRNQEVTVPLGVEDTQGLTSFPSSLCLKRTEILREQCKKEATKHKIAKSLRDYLETRSKPQTARGKDRGLPLEGPGEPLRENLGGKAKASSRRLFGPGFRHHPRSWRAPGLWQENPVQVRACSQTRDPRHCESSGQR